MNRDALSPEARREVECRYRYDEQCSLINDQVGCEVHLRLDICNKCFACRNEPEKAAEIRAQRVELVVSAIKRNGAACYQEPVVQAMLKHHLLPEERQDFLARGFKLGPVSRPEMALRLPEWEEYRRRNRCGWRRLVQKVGERNIRKMMGFERVVNVSICIAVQNESWPLELTIASILAGDVLPYEIVVVDDCSKERVDDRVRAMLRREPKIKSQVIRNATVGGSSIAKTQALRHATGELAVVMDSHLRLPSHWLTRLLEEYGRDDRAIYCFATEGTRGEPVAYGARFHEDRGFWSGTWRTVGGHVEEVPCVMGGCYAIPLASLERMGGFGNSLVGWGYEEEHLSLKAWDMGLTCKVIGDVRVQHQFKGAGQVTSPDRRGKDGTSVPSWSWHFNRHITAATIFGMDAYDSLIAPAMLAHYSDAQMLAELERRRHTMEDDARRQGMARVPGRLNKVLGTDHAKYLLAGAPEPSVRHACVR